MTMLGAPCSPCCDPCGCPAGESLPEAVTVAFSGLTKSANYVENLLGLKVSACYGTGATGTVSSKGGKPDEGFPIDSVTLTSGGSGYAKLGRVAPTLTITGSGTGATFTPTFESKNDACGIPTWSIKSVSASGGSGYQYGEELTVTVASGSTQVAAAAITLQTTRQQPTLTASASGGSGASLSVSIAANGTTPETWGVSSVSVTNGGTGYPATGSVTFTKATGDIEEQAASATFYSGRVAPTVTVAVGGSGSGAVLSGTLSSSTGWDGKTYWYISGISITNGGSGYSENDPVNATVTDGVSGEYSYFYALVSVDGGGVVTGVTVYDGGEFYKSNGIIASVEIDYYGGGSYYKEGPASAVIVNDGGQYYREDSSASPYVAGITVSVTQGAPSDGEGAEITATVDANTSSPNFGKITGLTLDDGGDGYLAWSWTLTDCPVSRFNGKSFLLQRVSPTSCEYRKCYGPSVISVTYAGSGNPPVAGISGECSIAFAASEDDAPFSCSAFSFVATELLGGTATVTEGDSETIQSCEDVFNATGFMVEVEAFDWYQKYTTGTVICSTIAVSVGFPGDKYAGEYELSFYGTSSGWKLFRYYYDSDSQFCSGPFIELAIRASDYAMVISLQQINSITHIDTSGETYKELSELECSFTASGANCNRKYQVNSTASRFAGGLCACEPESFDYGLWRAPGSGYSSDLPTGGIPTVVIAETGSNLIRIGSVTVLND